jgi:hypothetical protein
MTLRAIAVGYVLNPPAERRINRPAALTHRFSCAIIHRFVVVGTI